MVCEVFCFQNSMKLKNPVFLLSPMVSQEVVFIIDTSKTFSNQRATDLFTTKLQHAMLSRLILTEITLQRHETVDRSTLVEQHKASQLIPF